ncbi:DUF5789 family protein [Halococcoides cellulosivorans]|uniref:Uncharacterized protein n=1 Tax=Halococcoides cellulosivorans TaxID=1679096 RepID=A0A2R4X2M0_9EURY|nr:hypothetical protein [Halococcoides cellulosivorans]AWB28046.1 hypothetical protein HARCEL1_10170 [Halococcoides cellulosivorans]
MADDKSGRTDQAHDADRRRRERDLAEQLERMDEPRPPIEDDVLDPVIEPLDGIEFPATSAAVVATIGDRAIEMPDDHVPVADLLPNSERIVFESTAAVRARTKRPTVAAAMKRIVEAADELQEAEFDRSRREAYEKTLRALAAIDATDDDQPVDVIADWIVDHVHANDSLPGSRAVRRQAAKHCRSQDYAVSNNDWLGI